MVKSNLSFIIERNTLMNTLEKSVVGNYVVQIAGEEHKKFAEIICDEMANSASQRGTGIAKRSPEYLKKKMEEGKAVIATTKEGEWVGFCYIESWDHERFVANSGLIVHPDFRKSGIATNIKAKAFRLSRKKFPNAKIIGLTTSMAVMKINSELGYDPVSLTELPQDEEFWKGCSSCVNYDVLTRTNRQHCLCTGMLFDPNPAKKKIKWDFLEESGLYERWMRIKNKILLKRRKENAV